MSAKWYHDSETIGSILWVFALVSFSKEVYSSTNLSKFQCNLHHAVCMNPPFLNTHGMLDAQMEL